MGHRVFQKSADLGPRPGLEGPFYYPNGRALYYDARQGQYWDPRTDFYVSNDEMDWLREACMDTLR